MMNDKISVVMATYNGGKYLRQQLDSILNQDLRPLEIIVSDDCSTDNTVEILKEYTSKELLSFFVNEQRLGVIDNFKYAASKANAAHYIAFADQDDIWYPNKLSRSLAVLKNIEQAGLPCMVYSDPEVLNIEGIKIADSLWDILGYNNYRHELQTLVFGNTAGGCTMLINPSLASCIKDIPSDGYMHDAWLTLLAYLFGKAAIVPAHLMGYRQHDKNVTFSTDFIQQNRFSRVFMEVKKSITGKTDLFDYQFPFIKKFYAQYSSRMNSNQRQIFEQFLKLENSTYLQRKLAFRKAMKRDSSQN